MTWVCDQCYSAMEEIEESDNRKRIHCPNCGTELEFDFDGDCDCDDCCDECDAE